MISGTLTGERINTASVLDRGMGWQVEVEWYGKVRPVFRADPEHDPFIQLGDCWHFMAEHELALISPTM